MYRPAGWDSGCEAPEAVTEADVQVVAGSTLDKDLDSQENAIDAWEYNHEKNVDRPDQVRVFKVADATCPAGYEPVTTRYECALAGHAMTGSEVASDRVEFTGNPNL